ncbi:Vicilin-like seed storage protein [Glycine soja]
MEPRKASPLSWVLIFFLTISLWGVKVSSEEHHHHGKSKEGPVVERDQRRTLLVTEFGEITAIDIKEGQKELPYHLQFITLEPNSLFLPVLLQAEMVFYVHTGSGKLTWANDDGTSTIRLREGDVCSLNEGSVFYIQSNLEAERRKLRIYAMFTNTDDNTYDPSIGAYSRINELVKGFDKKIMQAALKVPEDLIEAIINKTETPAIVHAVPEKRNIVQELEASFLKNFLGVGSNSKKLETYNIFEHDPDFKNPIGWSTAVTKKQLKSLKRTNIGFLMVNLNMGSILGPHWNAKATELTVGVDGEGMVRVVCGSGNENETECQNMRFKVKEGDAFLVPRFHPMAQMSFNNGPFVFLGFSTSAKKNHPQFLAGKGSVLHILDKKILARSLGVSNRTIDELLRSPEDSIIFRCSSCAEEEEKIMKEEEEEEESKKEEEERKKKEEEEEEEEKKKKEERKREEEEAKRQQEEREKKRGEEEAKREREEEKARMEKERERKGEEEAEREEEEARREQEWRRKKEEAAAKREQEKRERRRQEEEAKKWAEEKAEREQEQATREAEEAQREQEQAKREAAQREQERAKREQERRRREEVAGKGEEEEEHAGRGHERKKEEEETARREQEQEQAERQQQKREKRRQKEEQGEGEEEEEEDEEEPTWWERRERRKQKGKSPEEGVEWEQEEARTASREGEKKTPRE